MKRTFEKDIQAAQEKFNSVVEDQLEKGLIDAEFAEMCEEGCYCHHPTCAAPCGYCENVPEEIFEVQEILTSALEAEDRLRNRVRSLERELETQRGKMQERIDQLLDEKDDLLNQVDELTIANQKIWKN